MNEIFTLIDRLINLAHREHYYCEDSWYSCPLAEDGCSNDQQGDKCNCGADEINAEIISIKRELKQYKIL